jgi:HAD superfamily hydrolase (TIGR01509 family)
MIKNLVFDFGKVLICYDYPSFLRTIIDDEEECHRFEAVVCSDEFVQRCDLGEETFFDLIKECQVNYPHWRKQLQEFYDRQLDAMTVEMPGMRDILTRLKAEGYRLYGLTNWSDAVYDVIRKFDILQMMDERLISSEELLIKPDVAIYDRLCEKFGLIKEECLLTDDKQVNIDGAKAAGMSAILFSDARQFEEELKKYGVMIS